VGLERGLTSLPLLELMERGAKIAKEIRVKSYQPSLAEL
jgi:hypothetical protein